MFENKGLLFKNGKVYLFEGIAYVLEIYFIYQRSG